MEGESAAADIAMDVFGSNPLEIIDLNFVSVGLLTFVNNFWTWLAVATAAVSFWRFIRPSTAPTTTIAASTSRPTPTPPSLEGNQINTTRSETLPEKNELPSQGSIKFTVYYDEDSYQDDENDNRSEEKYTRCYQVIVEDDREGLLYKLQEVEDYSMEKWEVVLKWKMGEIGGKSRPGWYTHQDLTNLNGNVVRLWDAPKSATRQRLSVNHRS